MYLPIPPGRLIEVRVYRKPDNQGGSVILILDSFIQIIFFHYFKNLFLHSFIILFNHDLQVIHKLMF